MKRRLLVKKSLITTVGAIMDVHLQELADFAEKGLNKQNRFVILNEWL